MNGGAKASADSVLPLHDFVLIVRPKTSTGWPQKLNSITNCLGLGVYGKTLSRTKGWGGEKSRLGMATLMWISHSEWPLKADELCHTLGVEIRSPDLDGYNVPSIGTSLSCC